MTLTNAVLFLIVLLVLKWTIQWVMSESRKKRLQKITKAAWNFKRMIIRHQDYGPNDRMRILNSFLEVAGWQASADNYGRLYRVEELYCGIEGPQAKEAYEWMLDLIKQSNEYPYLENVTKALLERARLQ